MFSNCTKRTMVVTRSMSKALISSTPVSRQQYQFHDDPKKSEFRMSLNSKFASIKYRKDGDFYDLEHTYVPKEFEGRGIGKIIAEKSFEHIKENNLRMKLTCEYLIHVHEKFGDKYKAFVVTKY